MMRQKRQCGGLGSRASARIAKPGRRRSKRRCDVAARCAVQAESPRRAHAAIHHAGPHDRAAGVLLAENPNGILLYRDEIMGFAAHGARRHESDRVLSGAMDRPRHLVIRSHRARVGFASAPSVHRRQHSARPFRRLASAAQVAAAAAMMVGSALPACRVARAIRELHADRSRPGAARERACALFRQVDALRPADLAQEQEDGMHYLRFDEPAQQVFCSGSPA